MTTRSVYFSLITVFSFFLTTYSKNAYAYLDPGTGSYLLQMLIAALLGGLIAIKIFWNKIKETFQNIFRGKNKHGDQ